MTLSYDAKTKDLTVTHEDGKAVVYLNVGPVAAMWAKCAEHKKPFVEKYIEGCYLRKKGDAPSS